MGLGLKKLFFEKHGDADLGSFFGRKERHVYPRLPVAEARHPVNEKLTIFVVSNLRELGSATRCLDFYGVSYLRVGQHIVAFDGVTKLAAIIDFIPTVQTEYVMLIDSDDIFIPADRFSDLVANYEKEYQCKMLFQAESWCFPPGDQQMCEFESGLVEVGNPYKHLNSGIWIAKTDFLQSLQAEIASIKPYVPGDQPVFKELYRRHHPEIKIDSQCKYFQSLAWSWWFETRYPGVLKLEVEQ